MGGDTMNGTRKLKILIKKALNKVLSLFPIPKLHPEFIDMDKMSKEYALLGEINTENIEPSLEIPEHLKTALEKALKKDIKIYINGKEFVISQTKGSD